MMNKLDLKIHKHKNTGTTTQAPQQCARHESVMSVQKPSAQKSNPLCLSLRSFTWQAYGKQAVMCSTRVITEYMV